MLNHFVKSLNGKGRSLAPNGTGCLYVNKDHPGCAIGCQLEFEPFKNIFNEDGYEGLTVADILRERNNDLGERFAKAFGVTIEPDQTLNSDDCHFLSTFQSLHDGYFNWDKTGLVLQRTSVENFCHQFGLKVPKAKYNQE